MAQRARTVNRRLAAWLLALAMTTLYGCSAGDAVSAKSFVGKWKSSKLETPIYLHENGEWEIKTDDGAVLQFGVWQYKDKKIIWSYKVDGQIGHDANAVLSAAAREFQVQERDRTTTTFVKLD
jgi:hypothetical protein